MPITLADVTARSYLTAVVWSFLMMTALHDYIEAHPDQF